MTGLQGIDVGNKLIQRAVQALVSEWPHLEAFSSLSPIPGFTNWLRSKLKGTRFALAAIMTSINLGEGIEFFVNAEVDVLCDAFNCERTDLSSVLSDQLKSGEWFVSPGRTEAMKAPLHRLVASYLYHEKHRGYCLNSVGKHYVYCIFKFFRVKYNLI